MINPWFKFYGNEFLADPKIAALTAQERSCWITLLCLANSSSVPGTIEFLTVEVLLGKSGIIWDPYHPEEWDKCLSVLQKLEKLKMIKAGVDGVINVLNWKKRQESCMTDAERARIYREKKKEGHENVTDRPTNVTIEKRREEQNRKEEIREEGEGAQGLPSDPPVVLPDWLDKAVWADWITYRKKTKKTTSAFSQKLNLSFLEEHIPDHQEILKLSIQNGWAGLFPLKKGFNRNLSNSIPNAEKGKYDNIVKTIC